MTIKTTVRLYQIHTGIAEIRKSGRPQHAGKPEQDFHKHLSAKHIKLTLEYSVPNFNEAVERANRIKLGAKESKVVPL